MAATNDKERVISIIRMKTGVHHTSLTTKKHEWFTIAIKRVSHAHYHLR